VNPEPAESVRGPVNTTGRQNRQSRAAFARASQTRAMLHKVIKYLPVILPVAMKIIRAQRAKGTATSSAATRTRR
jgi:hypothetical protein